MLFLQLNPWQWKKIQPCVSLKANSSIHICIISFSIHKCCRATLGPTCEAKDRLIVGIPSREVDIGKRHWHSTHKQTGLLHAYAKRKVKNGQHEWLQKSDVPCDFFGAECRAKFILWQFYFPFRSSPLSLCSWMRTAFQSTAGARRLPQMPFFFFFFNGTSALNRLHGDVPWSFQRHQDNSHEDCAVCMSDMLCVCMCKWETIC